MRPDIPLPPDRDDSSRQGPFFEDEDDVQLERGYTRIANKLLERILQAPITFRQMKVALAIARETYGWAGRKKSKDEVWRAVKTERIEQLTHIYRRDAFRTIRGLLSMKMIERHPEDALVRTGHGLRRIPRYRIQKHYGQWDFRVGKLPTPRTDKAPKPKEKQNSDSGGRTTHPNDSGGRITHPNGGKSPTQNIVETVDTQGQAGTLKKSLKKGIYREPRAQSPVVILEGYFKEAYKQKFRREYPQTNYGKDRRLLKTLLQTQKMEDLKEAIDLFMADDRPFFKDTGHTLGVFSQNVSSFVEKITAKQNSKFREI